MRKTRSGFLFCIFLSSCAPFRSYTDANEEILDPNPIRITASPPPLPIIPNDENRVFWKRLSAPVVRINAGSGGGSGIIVHENGFIITASHVVRTLGVVQVALCRMEADGTFTEYKWLPADVIRINRGHDIALIRLREPPPGLPVAQLHNQADYEANDRVWRVGHGNVRLAQGVIVSPDVPHDDLMHTIELNMRGGPGNSGGPIYNEAGEVIGLAIASTRPHFYPEFAIPISVIAQTLLREFSIIPRP